MCRRIIAIIKKETAQMLRDRATLVISISIPIILITLFGFAVKMDVKNIPTAITDQSKDPASRKYIDSLVNSGYFKITEYLSDENTVRQAIDDNEVQVGIIIPPNFVDHINQGDAETVILVDGSDPFVSLAAYSNATVISKDYSIGIVTEKASQSGTGLVISNPLVSNIRILYNPDLKDIWFVIPSIIAMLLQTQAISLVVTSIVREREIGTMEQILVTPIEPIELLIGKMIPNLGLLAFNLAMVLLVGVVGFKVPFQGNLFIFILLVMVYFIACMGLGLLISTIAENQTQAQQINMLFLLVGLVVSGFIFPRNSLPLLIKWLGYVFPLTYFIPIARGVISKGVGIVSLWPMIAILFLYSMAILFISARTFKQNID